MLTVVKVIAGLAAYVAVVLFIARFCAINSDQSALRAPQADDKD